MAHCENCFNYSYPDGCNSCDNGSNFKEIKLCEVVHTKHYLDVGLVIEHDKLGNPKRIRARYYASNPKAEYGGVDYVTWIKTGIFLSEKEWDKITLNKTTPQIIAYLKIERKKENNKVNDVWKKIFKKYIDDFHAIDKLESDNIIDDEDTYKLKNKLLADIICTFESEVNE